MVTIDRSSPMPLYYQLKQVLLRQIEKAEWQPGDLIPSEVELQEMYGLSRTTVRQTLSEMVFEGRLIRQRGRGTFVAEPKLAHNPHHIGISQAMAEQGVDISWQVLDKSIITAPAQVKDQLQLTQGGKILAIRRLRLADGKTIGHHIASIPASMASLVDETALTSGASLAYLHNHPLIANSRAERTIEAVPAGDAEVDYLGLKKGAPVLKIKRLVVAQDGTPIEFTKAYYRGDRFKYQITL